MAPQLKNTDLELADLAEQWELEADELEGENIEATDEEIEAQRLAELDASITYFSTKSDGSYYF